MSTNIIYDKALKFVLQCEGGFVDDPDDHGGATNKGITQRVYDTYRKTHNKPVQNVQYISDIEVSDIYYKNYWLKANCHKMIPVFAVIAFDTAVNMGVGRVDEFMKEAEYKYPDKFLLARVGKYVEFAKYGNQQKFLLGWLNRIMALQKFLNTI